MLNINVFLILATIAYRINAGLINVKIVSPIIYEDVVTFDAIQVSIYDVVDRLRVYINTSQFGHIVPNNIDYVRTSQLHRHTSIAFSADEPGIYKLDTLLSGISQPESDVVYENGIDTIEVLSNAIEPPKPLVSFVMLSNDGSSIDIKFDSITNQGGFDNVFKCNELLEFNGIEYSTCQWFDLSTIQILGSKLSENNMVTVMGNKILPKCVNKECVTNFVDETSIRCIGPANPIFPNVSIATSLQIGGCNPIVLDLSDSSGSGERDWKDIYFEVTSSDVESAINIQRFLHDNYKMSPPTKIPASYYVKGTSYTFIVTLTNIFKKSSSSTITISISQSESMPVAHIVGLPMRYIKSMDVLQLSTIAYTTTCSNSGESVQSTVDIEYSWKVFLNNVEQLNIISESKDISKFKLSPHKLASLNIYEIRLTVTNDVQLSVTTSAFINVLKSNIIASIDVPTTLSIVNGKSIIINASSSIDLDTGNNIGLIYNWHCIQILPSLSECALTNFDSSITTPSIITRGTYSAIDTTSRISITVTDELESRTSTAYVDITINSDGSPVVLITSSIKSLTSINIDNSVAILANIENQGVPCNATWRMNGNAIDKSITLTPVNLYIESGTIRTISLVIMPNALPQRSNFILSLSCNHVSSSIMVSTNGHPLPGIFEITPSNGIELQTRFMFSASGWYDPDLPISYMFGFKTEISGKQSFAVQGKSQLSYGESVLPSSLTYCTVDVYDSLGASCQATATTIVTQSSAVELSSIIQTQLNSLSSNADEIRQVLSTASAVLNQVNCTITPTTLCDKLNRLPCSKTTSTCGVCKLNYIGDVGDKNTICIVTGTTFPNESKTCDQSCNGHGECIMIRTYSGLYIDECKFGDDSCHAICECHDGFSGYTCASTTTDIIGKQNIRKSLIMSLSGLIQNEDASVDTISTWASSLDAVTRNADEVSIDSSFTVQDVAFTILSSAMEIGSSPDSISTILSAIDSSTNTLINAARRRRHLMSDKIIIDVDNIVIDESISKSIELLGMYGNIIASQLYPGQSSVETILDSFRLSTQAFSSVDGDVMMSTPLTEREKNDGIVPMTVSCMTTSDIKINTVVSKSKLFGDISSKFNSNALRFQIDGIESNASVVIVLQNSNPIEFQTIISPYTFEHVCIDGEIGIVPIVCPDSGFIINFECHGWVDKLNATCPSQTQRPQCLMLSDSNTKCERLSYTATNTTCVCIITTSAIRRRLDIVDDTGAADLVAMSKFIANEFAGTLSTPPTFNSWDDLTKVMIVLLMFGTFWGAGFGLILLCICKRQSSQKKERLDKVEMIKKREISSKIRSPVAIREYLIEYANSVFPEVFRPKPFITRMCNEISKNHRYIYLFTSSGKGSDKTRILTGVQLLTTQSLLMFLIAVFYELDGPSDDGTCIYNIDETSCLTRKSIFDVKTTFCQFTDGVCEYKEPEFSIKSIALIGILISFTTCMFTSPLDILFNILNAPTTLYKLQNARLMELRNIPNETECAHMTAIESMKVIQHMVTINRDENKNLTTELRDKMKTNRIYMEVDIDDVIDIETPYIDKFTQFTDDIYNQRRIMLGDKLDEFDEQWGIDPTGSFSKRTDYALSKCGSITISTEKILRDTLQLVERESNLKINKLKTVNDNYIGLEMLHTFILDLLGYDSIAAKIFISKSDEDYSYTKSVSVKIKGLAWTGIIIINIFFVYYSMMRGMIRGRTWQYAYMYGCLAQLLFEIIVAETFEVLWVHFIIPNLVAKEVKQSWTTIMDIIEHLTTTNSTIRSSYLIDAPTYLFVSTNLANEFPNLPESSIIAAYHNHLPGEMSKKWHIDRSIIIGLSGDNNTWIRFLTFTTVVSSLKYLGASPFMIQRMIIRITSPIFTAITVWLWINIISNPVYFYIIGLTIMASIGRICYNNKK